MTRDKFNLKERDELLQKLASISNAELEANYQQYEVCIHKLITTPDDLIACSSILSPEKFQLILPHMNVSCFHSTLSQINSRSSLKCFLEAPFVPIYCKKLILINEYRFIDTADKFSKTLEEVRNASIGKEEKQSLLLCFFVQGLKEYHKFASSRWFFYTLMAVLNELSPFNGENAITLENFIIQCVAECVKSTDNKVFNQIIREVSKLSEESQKLWIKFISPILKEYVGFCKNSSELRSTISSVDKLCSALKEKEGLLIALIRNPIYGNENSNKSVNDFCLMIESITTTSLLSATKESLVTELIIRMIRECCSLFKLDYDYFCVVSAITKSSLLEVEKKRVLKKFLDGIYINTAKKNPRDVTNLLFGIEQYFLEGGKQTFLIAFIELANEKVFSTAYIPYKKILQRISEIFHEDDIRNNIEAIKKMVEAQADSNCYYHHSFDLIINKINKLGLKLEFKRIVLLSYLDRFSQYCNSSEDFQGTVNNINYSPVLSNEDKSILLMHFVYKNINKYVGLCKDFSEFSGMIDVINNVSHLLIKKDQVGDKKQDFLFEFYANAIQNYFGFCDRKEPIFYKLIEKICNASMSNNHKQDLLKSLINLAPVRIKGLKHKALIKWIEQQPNLETEFKRSLISSLDEQSKATPKISKIGQLLSWLSCGSHSKNKIEEQYANLEASFSKK